MSDELEETKKYGLTFIVKGEDASSVKETLAKYQAVILGEKPFEKVQLSYPIKREKYGFFSAVNFSLKPGLIQELSHDLRLADDMLRFVINAVSRRAAEKTQAFRPVKTSPAARPIKRYTEKEPPLTNEALEKKIEEILK